MHRSARISIATATLLAASVARSALTADPPYEQSSNDGLGYESVVVNGHYRNFAPIHEAAKRGDTATIQSELREGVPVDLRVRNQGGSSSWTDTTPLMWAAMRGTATAVRALLAAGADPNASDRSGITPLMYAAGAVQTVDDDALLRVQALLASGADPNATDGQGRNALAWACGTTTECEPPATERIAVAHRFNEERPLFRPFVGGSIVVPDPISPHLREARCGDLARVELLLTVTAPPTTPAGTASARTLLSDLAMTGNVDRARAVRAAGFPLSEGGPGRWSALTCAAAYGTADMVRFLLEEKLDPNAADSINCSQTTLIWAARSHHDSGAKVRMLLAAGADPTRLSDQGVSALFASVAQNATGEGIRPLLEAGVDPTAVGPYTESLLVLAAQSAVVDGLEAVLSIGPTRFDPNARSSREDQATVLMLAAGSERDAAAKVRLLIERGAAVDSVTATGRTPALFAGAAGNMDALIVLAEAGADVLTGEPDGRDGPAGCTPLMYAARRGGDSIFLCRDTGAAATAALLRLGVPLDARDRSGVSALDHADVTRNDEVAKLLRAAGAAERLPGNPIPRF